MLAVALGLWVRRRTLTSRLDVLTRAVLSVALWPVVWSLIQIDRRPPELGESTLLVGLSASIHKPS